MGRPATAPREKEGDAKGRLEIEDAEKMSLTPLFRSITAVPLLICISLAVPAHAEDSEHPDNTTQVSGVALTLDRLHVTNTVLTIGYQITNSSSRDIWLCDDVRVGVQRFEIYLAEDNETLILRRRFAVPQEVMWPMNPMISYRRLRSEDSLSESLSLRLPARPMTLFTGKGYGDGVTNAARVVLEVGFHFGDLFCDVLKDVGRRNKAYFDVGTIRSWATFTGNNELLVSDRNEQLVFWWPSPVQDREQILRTAVDGQRIPYDGRDLSHTASNDHPIRLGADWRPSGYRLRDLRSWTRVEVIYQPSILEFFFPSTGQRNLFSPSEQKYLQSCKTSVMEDKEQIRTLGDHLLFNAIAHVVSGEAAAHVTCYRDAGQVASFNIHPPNVIEIEDGRGFSSWHLPEAFETLAPAIRPFNLRVQCARNLQNLCYRLRIHHRLDTYSTRGRILYPSPTEWCDALMVFQTTGNPKEWPASPWACPFERVKGSHYAMNPDCQYDSPPHTVLLFETAAGWNQNGGPELCTFDRHDPRGGMVVLNDGTVKFIRTEEELKQLRWK